jgi:hypothetical protein
MAKRIYRDLFGIFGKWLGAFLEIFQKPGSSRNCRGLRLDYKEIEGPLCKFPGIIDFQIYFSTENPVDRVHSAWTGRCSLGPLWTEAARTRGCGGALSAHGTRALGLTDGGGGGRARQSGARGVLTEARVAVRG